MSVVGLGEERRGPPALVVILAVLVALTLVAVAVAFLLGRDRGPGSASARILDAEAEVRQGGEGAFVALESGDTVAEGSVIRTGATGTVELSFDDGSITRIGPATTVEITEARAGTRHRTIRQRVRSGVTWHNVAGVDGGDRYEVATAVATAASDRARFGVVCVEPGTCVVTVVEGELVLTLVGGAADELEPGETVRVDATGAGPVRRLSTPELDTDPWVATNRLLDAGRQPPPTSTTTTTTTAPPAPAPAP